MARKPKAPGSLTTKHWFGYMFGDWGGCMTFALMASIFSIYCTNVLGVNAADHRLDQLGTPSTIP